MGVSYGRTPAILVNAAQINNGLNVVSLMFTGNQVPQYPQVFADLPGTGLRPPPTIFYIDRGFASPRLLQASAGWEWSDTTSSAGVPTPTPPSASGCGRVFIWGLATMP